MRAKTLLLAFTLVAATAVPLAFAAPPANHGNGNGGWQADGAEIQLNLTGTAIRTDGGPDDSYTFYVNATGPGDVKYTNGDKFQVHGNLDASVIVVDADGNEVENYTASVKFHGQSASHVARGLEGFKFNMQLTGKRDGNVQSNTDSRVLAFNAHGDSVYVDETDDGEDNGEFTVTGRGQTTTQPGGQGNGAAHYNFLLGGTGTVS